MDINTVIKAIITSKEVKFSGTKILNLGIPTLASSGLSEQRWLIWQDRNPSFHSDAGVKPQQTLNLRDLSRFLVNH